MIEQAVRVAKKGLSALSTDPNDFVFHSSYNTFKIIAEASKSITVVASTADQTFTQAHNLEFIPLVHAFAKRDSASQVFAPNGIDVEIWGAKLGMSGDITFNYVQADATNVMFNFDSIDGSNVDVTVRYFLLEAI